MECYVFPTQAAAQACVDFINSTSWFPVIGNREGKPDPDAQKTEKWMDAPLELLTGEWAVTAIPQARLDAVGVPQQTRDEFISGFGQDIRELSSEDIVRVEEEIP